jgi:elongation factor Ts
MGARFVSRDLVPQEKIEKEKEIYAAQAKESGKPAHIIEKIVESKLESFYKENCLLEQEYVFESGKTINDLIVELISKTGENIKVKKFVRWQVGESES